ncbi:MAG: transglutaminase domain-containing protein, partial [bacterium]|nr:transglutaminase domain-containing protein [bacterium]
GLEPWLFHHRIPTLLSEITYQKPANLSLDPWFKETAGGKIQMESHRTPRGVELRARMEDLIAIPDEPYGFPFADLSSRFMIVPKEFTLDGTRRLRLFDSWENAFAGFGENYARFRRDGSRARKQASTVVAAGGANSRRDRMTAVFAFVRDEIRTLPSAWVGVTDRSADQVLAERQGDHVGKALLLRTMLEAVKTKTRLVWAADKSDGRVYLDVANPWWFERVLVLVEVDGERIFLDPSDRRLGFGRLAPHYEGTQALIPHSRRSEIITLPLSPSEGNVRRAVVGLRLDGEGRLTGTGTLVLNGHHA